MKTIYNETKGINSNYIQVRMLTGRKGYQILDMTVITNGIPKEELTAYFGKSETDLVRLAIQTFDAAVANHPVLGKEKSE